MFNMISLHQQQLGSLSKKSFDCDVFQSNGRIAKLVKAQTLDVAEMIVNSPKDDFYYRGMDAKTLNDVYLKRELKAILKKEGQPVSGNKPELGERLFNHMKSLYPMDF